MNIAAQDLLWFYIRVYEINPSGYQGKVPEGSCQSGVESTGLRGRTVSGMRKKGIGDHEGEQ